MTEKNEDSERIDSIPLLWVIVLLQLVVIGCFVWNKWKRRFRNQAPDLHELTLLNKEHEDLSSKDSSSEASNVIPTNRAATFITEQELEDLRNKENAVNGEKFVHNHLRYDKDSPKGLKRRIRNASSLILNDLGIKMEEMEVYVRHVGWDNQENDAIRSWIQENREKVIEEMDSDVIDTICNMNNMEAVSTEIGATLSAAIGRKEKAELFLDFALRNDEYLKALIKTLEENVMRVWSD